MKHVLLITALLTPLGALHATEGRAPVPVESKRNCDMAKHCAFTDLSRFRDQWFCSFREGEAHAPGDGKIRTLRYPH